MMKNKEEILNYYRLNFVGIPEQELTEKIKNCMQDFAKEVAIDFASFLNSEKWNNNPYAIDDSESPEVLYDEYLKSKSNE
jgi:hypothetical protein